MAGSRRSARRSLDVGLAADGSCARDAVEKGPAIVAYRQHQLHDRDRDEDEGCSPDKFNDETDGASNCLCDREAIAARPIADRTAPLGCLFDISAQGLTLSSQMRFCPS